MSQTKLATYLDEPTKFSGMVAALGHDVGHRGKNNSYEMSSMSELAITYHDISVLEQYHINVLLDILLMPKCNILGSLTQSQWRDTRATIIECILATDMSKHVPLLDKFEAETGDLQSRRDNLTNEEKNHIAAVFVHMCDLSNGGKKFEISFKWSNFVKQEFMQQVKIIKNLIFHEKIINKELRFQSALWSSSSSSRGFYRF